MRAAVAAAIGTAFLIGSPTVSAQSAADTLELEEVQVTGSRIVRRDLVSNSPLVTVDNTDLETRTGLNIESYLNQLPNFNPSFSPTTTQGDVQITPVNTVGIAALSLRGFGPNRSLVLVDGRRPTPVNALMVPDINAIPSALIQRVEIISGGASAVYGADAIGGVTNFIMRKDFQGLELDAQTGITEVGDNEENRISALLGTNFAEGRGNVTIGLEHYDRKAAYERDRKFYTNAWADPTVAGDLFLFGYNGYNTGDEEPNPATLDALFAGRPAGTGYRGLTPTGTFTGYRFNADGSIFTTVGDNLWKYLEGGGVLDGREFAIQRVYDGSRFEPGMEVDAVKWNNLQALASGPQKRYSMFASGHYDVSDSMRFFARGTWAQSKTRTLLLPTNASLGWEASIPYNPTTDSPVDPGLDYTNPATVTAVLANPGAFANPGFIPTNTAGAGHPVPVELAVLLNSRDNPLEPWIAETYPNNSFDQRATLNTIDVWNVEAGLQFDLGASDWTGEVFVSHGESSTYTNAFGNNSLTRWRALVAEPDYGRGAELTGNTDGARPTFGAADVTCTSGFYDMLFHADVRPADDCRFAVGANLQSRTQAQQNIMELNLQGGLFMLPAGQVRSAVGFQYRENAAQFYPDILQSTASFTDQVIGVYPTGYLDAKTSVRDYYGELLVPVLSDLPFADRIELELGGRYSDYSDTDNTFTYKISGNWQISDQWRLRGGFNRATRAPNLGELFLNEQEIFTIGGANFSDPCSVRSSAPYGAGGAADDPVLTGSETNPPPLAAGQTAAGAQSAYLICQAQMGAVAAAEFYDNSNHAAGGGSLFNWILQEGNPNLDSEKANTWTAGLVFTSQANSPWLAGLSAAVDWWKVDIEDAIQQYSVDYARYLCYGAVQVTTPAEAAAQANSVACRNAGRDLASGVPTTVKIAYDNQATIATSGIDLQLNWRANLADIGLESVPGGFGVNMQYSILDYYKTKQSPTVFDVETDWEGTLGPNLTGTNPGAYSYRLNTSFAYILNDMSFSLRWRHLPSVWPAAKASEEALIANNEAVAAGGEGITLTYTPGTWIKTKSYNQIDLSWNWSVNDTLSVRAGIDNVFDWMPRITGATRGYPAGTDLSAVCGGAPGCTNPFGPSLGSTGRGTTSPGYYDVLGRRFFLGLKVQL